MEDLQLISYLVYQHTDAVFAFGCTGGKHRSPVIAEEIARILGNKYLVNVIHRDK